MTPRLSTAAVGAFVVLIWHGDVDVTSRGLPTAIQSSQAPTRAEDGALVSQDGYILRIPLIVITSSSPS